MIAESPTLSRFDGPLDLLLELINRRTLDITTISLAAVAEQYLEEVARLSEVDLERLAGYLLIASRLLLIKSQALLPRPPREEDEESGADLVQQLAEYRRYKEVALQLRQVEEKHARAFPRQSTPPLPTRLTPGAGDTLDLVSAFSRALSLAPPPPPTVMLAPTRFRVADKVRDLSALMDSRPALDFSEVVERASCRAEVVAFFLGLLELLRRGKALVWQEGLFGRITLAKPDDNDQPCDGDAESGADGIDDDVDRVAVASGSE